MSDFFTLVSIENKKMWKRLSTKIMLILMIVIVVGSSFIYRYVMSLDANSKNAITVSDTWKDDMKKDIINQKTQLAQTEKMDDMNSKSMIGFLKKTIAEEEYRINNNIKPETDLNIWSRVANFSGNYSQLIALFLLIVCASVVAGEFSDGTMKMMITRPFSRAQILSAKLVTVILYGLLLVVTTLLLSFVLMGAFYGFNELGAKDLFWTSKNILYISAALKTFIIFGLQFLEVLFYVMVAFVLSAVFRSRSLATGFSLFLLLVGGGMIRLLAMFFSWAKYLPFVLSNFTVFVTNGSYIYNTTLASALVTTILYAILFGFIGYFVFQKRDIS